MWPTCGAVVLVLALAFLPALNDACDIGCDLGGSAPLSAEGSSTAAASCPLHRDSPSGAPLRQAPPSSDVDRCGHDHVSIRAAETASATTTANPASTPLARTIEIPPMAPAFELTLDVQNRHSPPSWTETLSHVLRV